MDTEQTIYEEFAHKDLALVDAILRLERIGYTSMEAERLAYEWADALSYEDLRASGGIVGAP